MTPRLQPLYGKGYWGKMNWRAGTRPRIGRIRRALVQDSLRAFLPFILLLTPSSLQAQIVSDGQTAQGQQSHDQTAPSQPVKTPPPPVFPRHRRGLYTNSQNIEAIDATPQSPPLETDDPGVPDKGEYEINILTAADLTNAVHKVSLFEVDANYGILPKVMGHELPTQVKIEAPLDARRENGQPFTVGIGAALFGLKFNFYNNERTGLRVSVYPQFEVAASKSVEKGLADSGQTLIIPLLLSKEFSTMTMVANGGVEKPLHDRNRELTGTLGLGVGRAIWRKVALMGDVRGESTFDFRRDRILSASAGIIYGVRNVVWYTRLGHSLFADDGSHVFVAVGVKLVSSRGN
jgi:hypothetical protein